MSSHVLEDPTRRLELARTYTPRIHQEYESVFDLITPMSLEQVEEVVEDFLRITTLPTLSFGVRENDDYWWIYYLVYHPFDVSFHPIKLIRKLDSHRHDTEGILLRVSKEEPLWVDMVTVNHTRFLCESRTNRSVVIEASGHGIRPYSQGGPKGNFIVYKVFDYEDLNLLSSVEWEAWRSRMQTASMPDEQYDSIMLGSASGKLVNKKGDIWNRPERLFKSLKLKGRIK